MLISMEFGTYEICYLSQYNVRQKVNKAYSMIMLG